MLRLENISKTFPGVKALKDVSLQFEPGQVHAIVGENGAGKSTLMKILAGDLHADAGEMFLGEQRFAPQTTRAAKLLGIEIVHQERSLMENVTVAENLFPDRQPRNAIGLIQYGKLHAQASAVLERLAISDIATTAQVAGLSPGQKQMVEIAKALVSPCRILILDEPTASITYRETETLFRIIAELKQSGTAVIYISHRMNEIKQIADVVSVLKDGKLQATLPARDISTDELISLMVGRALPSFPYERARSGEAALDVRDLSGRGFNSVSFTLYKGEILGFSGLVGAGRTELALAIMGDERASSGEIYRGNAKINSDHPSRAISYGIAYVPEDRKGSGIFPEMSVSDNMIVSAQRKIWRKADEEIVAVENYINRLSIRAASRHQTMVSLSGGNQQKVILARWLLTNPDVLIIDEPTHGIDVGAKFEIYTLLKSLRDQGMSIIVISSDLPELLLISDRIAVMRKGELTAILDKERATEESIMRLASGEK